MEASQNEKVRLMANLQLSAKRALRMSINLDYLANDPNYARICLAEIEAAADDEELLVMVVRLREILLARPDDKQAPRPPAAIPEAPKPAPAEEIRTYKFGARSW